MFVPSSTVLKYTGTFSAWNFGITTLDDGISQVSAYLKNNYNLVVTDYQDDLDSDTGAGTVTLTLQTGMDRGNTGADDGVADIKSNCDDAFSNVASSSGAGITLTDSTCTPNSIIPAGADSGPSYSFSFRNLLPSWLGGSPVTPEQQAQYTAQGQAQIDTVAQNAKAAYGEGSDAASVAQSTASDQEQKFADDEKILAQKQNADAAQSDRWLLIGIGAVALVVLLVVVRPYVSAAQTVAA